eukprot:NODE_11209_length_1301_cov_2.976150.p1 GENE.NODE_11209_length_1301_cov_2.976150~~NODE_11209_length_1301_cov_2.976150.p1  ORF type:complete len:307 (-),score=105.08 NODE_11209_length_1301_cov_2.976150:130-1050(-)
MPARRITAARSLTKLMTAKKTINNAIEDTERETAEAQDALAAAIEDIKTLTTGITTLDKEVTEAGEQRKAEHADFVSLMAADNAAKQLLEFAKNRMNKFYNPKLYVPPKKRQLSEDERITVALGATIDEAPAPGGIANTGISALLQRTGANRKGAPPPPPETFGAYAKKGEENTGVMAMMDLLMKDLDKEMTVAKTTEEQAQDDYESLMASSKLKRTEDVKALNERTAAKAELDGTLEEFKEKARSHGKEMMATEKLIMSLHGECDWLVKFYDARKEARTAEVEALGRAKAVLKGADFSLVQSHHH